MYAKIKDLCKRQGISVRKLEKDLGFSTGSVCKWDDSSPSFERIAKVADYLKVPINEFNDTVANKGEK